MAQLTPVDILNRLHALHARSLPMYLQSAKPWSSGRDAAALEVLADIAHDQALMAHRIGAVVDEQGGTVGASEFPTNFTDLHDLSLDYLVPEVMRRQEAEIAFMEQCVSELENAPAHRAITEEALGAARGHLESLNELGVNA